MPPNASVRLFAASGLNDRGEIVAKAVLPNGDQHAYLLIPCDRIIRLKGPDYSLVNTTTIVSHPGLVVRDATTRTLIPLTMRRGYRPHFQGGAVGPRN